MSHGSAHDAPAIGYPPPAVEHHPSPKTYLSIAVTLAAITLLEVWIFYQGLSKGALAAVLLTLSAVKFALVVMFYMHLKFDNKLFTSLFAGGLAIAASMMMALLALFSIRH